MHKNLFVWHVIFIFELYVDFFLTKYHFSTTPNIKLTRIVTSHTVVLPRRDDQRERASDEQLVEEREEDKDHGEAVR